MASMSIKGGLKEFFRMNDGEERYLSKESPYGRKVEFLNRNGYEKQREDAQKYFHTGQILTVQEIYVGSSSSEVEFVEFPGKRFNTVMFADFHELKVNLIDRIALMNEVDLRTELLYIIRRIHTDELTNIYPKEHPFNTTE